ncbi:MAG: hypothetical protein Q9213_001718 [Squamulea squamosa]
MSKIITVFGATGNQGGSVIASIQGNSKLSSEYKIRGVTRDPSKPNGQALAQKGVELVKADLSDKESVQKAIEGSHAVFAVTNLTNGKLSHLPHFDAKADVADYIREQKIPASFLDAGCFMTNFTQALQKSEEGNSLTMNLHPDTKIPLFDAAADTGKFAAGILLHTSELLNKDVYAATGWYTPTDIVNAIEKFSGKKTTFNEVDSETYRKMLPEPIAEELMETFELVRDYAYYGPGGDKILAESLKVSG